MQYKEMPSETKRIAPQFKEESLLHKQFLEFCEIIDKQEIEFGFTTNAMLLSPEISKELLQFSNFNSISFSLDGLTAPVYEGIRRGASFETVIANIDTFLSLAPKDRNDIHTSVSFTCQDSNRHELDDFIRHWSPKTNINVNTVCYDGRPSSFFWKPERRIPCQDVFTYMVVLTGGKVTPCCRDYQYTFELGDLSKQSLSEVWNGPGYNELRKYQINGDYKRYPLCADCDTWMVHLPDRKVEMLDGKIPLRKGPFWISVPQNMEALNKKETEYAKKLGQTYSSKNILIYGAGDAYKKYIKYFAESNIKGIILDYKFLQQNPASMPEAPYINFATALSELSNIDGIIIFCRPQFSNSMRQKVTRLFKSKIIPKLCILY